MFPSNTDKLYGVFVQNMYTALLNQGVEFPHKSLIQGRANSRVEKSKKYLRHYVSILTSFFKRDYDILYVHYLSHHVPILWLLLPFKRKPWVVNVHGTDVIDLINHPKLDFWARKVLKKTDLLVVPSVYFRAKILEQYSFFSPEKVFVSPSGGLDLTHFYPLAQPKAKTELTVGFVSRFDESKGWKTYLEALVLLKEKQVPFKGMIIGKGPDEQKIKTEIKNRKLEDRIDFIGFVKQGDLVKYYQQMDVYLFPSHRESLGLTGLEAMACGIPVIGSAISALKTYIHHEENGLLFEPENPLDLAQKIENFSFKSVEKKEEMRKNALLTAKKYEREEVAKKLKERLEVLLA